MLKTKFNFSKKEHSGNVKIMLMDGNAKWKKRNYTSKKELIAIMQKHHISISDALLSFYKNYDGLQFQVNNMDFSFSIDLFYVYEDEEEQQKLDGLIAIGTGWSYHGDLFMNITGEIYSYFGEVRKVASSIEKMLEQFAMLHMIRSKKYIYELQLRPPMLKQLVKIFDLALIEDPSDYCTSWWKNKGYIAFQAMEKHDARSDCTFIFTKSLNLAVAALIKIKNTNDAVGATISSSTVKRETYQMDSGKVENFHLPKNFGTKGKHSLILKYDSGNSKGIISILKSLGKYKIEIYVYEDRDQKIIQWTSLSASTSVERHYFYPVSAQTKP